PSLVSAAGVMIAVAEGRTKYNEPHKSGWLDSSDIAAGYTNAAGTWPSIVAEIAKMEWKAQATLGSWNDKDHVSVWYWPTTIAKDNKVFYLREAMKRSTTILLNIGRWTNGIFNWLWVRSRRPRT
ncbi:surface protein-2, partial [Trypanosoma cruzi]